MTGAEEQAVSGDELQRAGANARARGESRFDNPYLKPQNMPSATGDTIEQWESKRSLWDLGWQAEEMMR